MTRNVTTTKKQNIGAGIVEHNLSVIIPCAGIGRRNKTFGPKCLFELNKKETILDRQIKVILEVFPKADITIITGFEHKSVYNHLNNKKYKVRIVYNNEYEYTNVAYSIGLGMQANYNDNVLVVYGDVLFNKQAIVNLTLGSSKMLVDSKGNFDKQNVGVIISDGCITNIYHGLETKWGQIFFLNYETSKEFQNIALKNESYKKFSYEILNDMIDKGYTFEPLENKDSQLIEIDNFANLEKAKGILYG